MLPTDYFNVRRVLDKIKTSLGREFDYEEILQSLNGLAKKNNYLPKVMQTGLRLY
jgi:hypothetical protein